MARGIARLFLLTLSATSPRQALLAIVWQSERYNPVEDGRVPVQYAERGAGLARVPPRTTSASTSSSAGGAPAAGASSEPASRLVSVVNLGARPLLIYVSLRDDASAAEHGLTPWEGAQPIDERPAPLSVGGGARGANCLLLAPYEGTEACVAEEAERAPFGESNTFRFVAASGETAEELAARHLPQRLRMRIEASFQQTGGSPHGSTQEATMAALLGTEYDDDDGDSPAAADATAGSVEPPFCILTL